MSLEMALEDERREVMNILEGRTKQRREPDKRGEPKRSAPPPRSMLDIDAPATSEKKSGPDQRTTSTGSSIRSMLDIGENVPARSNSPTATQSSQQGSRRARSDTPRVRPRALSDRGTINLQTDYQFNIPLNNQNQAVPKRVFQGGKKRQDAGSMAAARQQDRGRSQSPGGGFLPELGKFVTEKGKVIDMNSAYRKLSDAALLNSGGELSTLAINSKSARATLNKGETLSSAGEARLQKDYDPTKGNDKDPIESSDEEPEASSSGDEAWNQRNNRGRRRHRQKKGRGQESPDADVSDNETTDPEGSIGLGKAPRNRKSQSLLAAAEEERVKVSARYQVDSLLEPAITVTGPGGEKLSNRHSRVHPDTNYDQVTSGRASPANSDSEELSDIRRAQRLNIHSSPIDSSIPHRVIRTIIRGDFPKMQREAEDGCRRLRTYLVATDLSDEAAYALEWTIGTVLRDGDTLLAVYAVDEELGTGKAGDPENINSLPIGEGAKAMQDATAMVEKMTIASQSNVSPLGPSPLSSTSVASGSPRNSAATSVDSRSMSKADQERLHAIEGISQTCINFLRKTKLQVRIAVEVIHCKNPKYMITEAIDFLEPTLVVLGSRGRSALRGVLLGSFSNYLVTKSSVPVMVARKRLSGRKSKHIYPNVRLSNNLTPSKPLSLAEAKID